MQRCRKTYRHDFYMICRSAETYGQGMRDTLDEALSWGYVKGIVIANIMSLANNSTYDTPTINAGVITGNSTITDLVAEYSNLYPQVKFSIADRYTDFGGASPTSELFGSNDIHPTTKGHYVQSKTLYDGIKALNL